MHIDGVQQFDWSPTDNFVSLWIPEYQNQPAKVVLMEMPSRVELRQKNLFNVQDLHMHWHEEGHFLCVKVDTHSLTLTLTPESNPNPNPSPSPSPSPYPQP